MLSIGILTHNSPLTLKNTLISYRDAGLLEYTDDIKCLIQPSPLSDMEISVCNEFNIIYILETENTMMAGGIKKLVNESKYKYFLFLESDFRSCKNKIVTKEILDFAIYNLENNSFDVIRLRNLKNPGHPIHWNLQKREGVNYNNNTELYLCTHYLKEPDLIYPDYIQKISNDPILYQISSRNCVYTNNANITSKEFYINNIFPFIKIGCHLEPEIGTTWAYSNKYKIGITSGIFTHIRIDGHLKIDGVNDRNCYCCPKYLGGVSDNINCVCCIKQYIPTEFKIEDLSDIKNDIIDEDYMESISLNLKLNYF
jgi:hypothetical protein